MSRITEAPASSLPVPDPAGPPPRRGGGADGAGGAFIQPLGLPAGFALVLLAFLLLGPLRQQEGLFGSFLGAGVVLLVWTAVLHVGARNAGRRLSLAIALHRHHWVQACAQLVVLFYWGWHERFVFGFLPLIAAQLIFAYGVDSLLSWSRRDTYHLGFGPFPVILSINLFLWFKPEWFHWQFAMIAVGYLGKEFIRWEKGGRSAHIFNPSSFPLAVFSIALIATGASETTLGTVIANTQADPPYIYLVIFLAALPGQLLFGVARVTMPAVLTMYGISVLYFRATGTFLFFDSHIPLPVFLGMHLLVTDPSTAPRTESGRVAFGVLYGVATTLCFLLLSAIGTPSFYDKLLPVPILNLLVRRLDRLALSMGAIGAASGASAALWRALTSRQRNLVYTGVWAGAFIGMSSVQGVGDRHPGQYLPFWTGACEAGSERACEYRTFMQFVYCSDGSGWACNEWGIQMARRDRLVAPIFERACELGFSAGCFNADAVAAGGRLESGDPLLDDLPIVLRGTKGSLGGRSPEDLYELACGQGWPGACERAHEAGPR